MWNSQQQQQQSIPTSTSPTSSTTSSLPYQKALLFLAHQGMSQPEGWRKWRSQLPDGEDKLLFFVIMPPKEKNQLGFIRLFPCCLTEWAHESLVYVEQRGLQDILKYDSKQRIQQVYFLCGKTVPTKSAEFVYKLPCGTYWDWLPTPIGIGGNSFSRGTQWKSYNRTDANTVAQFDFSDPTFQQFDQMISGYYLDIEEEVELFGKTRSSIQEACKTEVDALEEDKGTEKLKKAICHTYDYYLNLLDRYVNFLKGATFPVRVGTCPDEFWIHSVLEMSEPRVPYKMGGLQTSMMNLKKVHAKKPIFHPMSPIEWASWESEYACYGRSGVPSFHSLHSELVEAAVDNVPFYRKVSKDLKWKQTWDLDLDVSLDVSSDNKSL
jgi:hypothetical protein